MVSEISVPDLIGIVGVVIVLTSYLFVQLGIANATSGIYQVSNMLACALIGISLWFSFNLPSAIIQALWFLISLFGFLRNIRRIRSEN